MVEPVDPRCPQADFSALFAPNNEASAMRRPSLFALYIPSLGRMMEPRERVGRPDRRIDDVRGTGGVWRGLGSPDDKEFLGKAGEDLATLVRDQDVILDPDAEAADPVKAGLDGAD